MPEPQKASPRVPAQAEELLRVWDVLLAVDAEQAPLLLGAALLIGARDSLLRERFEGIMRLLGELKNCSTELPALLAGRGSQGPFGPRSTGAPQLRCAVAARLHISTRKSYA